MKPLVIAHRGFSGRYPENTLVAIRAAIRLGVDYVEIDVQETSDGKLIVFHDDRLNRICGVSGRVRETSAARIRQLCPAVPLFGEVLRACRGKTRLLVEIKHADPGKVATTIRRHRMQHQVIVFTFSTDRLAAFAAAAPEISRFGLIEWQNWRRLPVAVDGLGIYRHRLWSRQVVARLHRRGWKVFVWTVNDVRTMRRLMAWGVDGVISNFPDRVLDLRAG